MLHTALPKMIYRPGAVSAAHAGCRTCEHFWGEWLARGAHALCRVGGRTSVQARPDQGCAFHLRAPGSDG
jgi:hypothetical protein